MSIRPSIYIGLGGTGIKAIAQAKKLFEDEYGKGNIPPQIAFLAVDFDLSTPNNSDLATNISDDFLQIFTPANPRELYQVRSQMGEYKWYFPENSRFLGDKISDGASQVRTYGRFLTEMVITDIKNRVDKCWNQVKNLDDDNGTNNVEKVGAIDIHIAMSLAGGTGCGSFLNIAQMVRDAYQNQAHIIGYGVIHGVFRAMDPKGAKTPRVISNSYSAIMDLDYLMTASPDHPVKMTINGNATELKQPLYDDFFVIDNVTENGNVVNNVKKLCEVIGTCLYVSSNELGSLIQAGQSNTTWRNGNYDISPKRGWVEALGACQVVYKGELLANIYGDKAARELIRQLQTAGSDAQQEAVKWTEEVSIREDGDQYDMLIDSIYAPQTIQSTKAPLLDVSDTVADIKTAVGKYMTNYEGFPNAAAIEARKEELANALQNKIDEILKQKGATGNAMAFLKTLRELCEKYKGEMNSERDEKLKAAESAKSDVLEKNYKDYEEYIKKLFKTNSGKEERLEAIAHTALKVKKNLLEGERRKAAAEIFVSLLNKIKTLSIHIEEIDNVLKTLANQYDQKIIEGQSYSESSLVFEYDLSTNERLNMKFNSEDVEVIGFSMSLANKLYDLDLEKGLQAAIDNYVHSLPQVDVYRNRIITDVIEELSEEEYKQLKKNIVVKSSRLLQLDDRGQVSRVNNNAMPTSLLVQNYLISIYKKDDQKTRLESDSAFLNHIEKQYVGTNSPSMKQKVIFYRSDMAVIPYCIRAFDDLTIEKEYTRLVQDAEQQGSSFIPHFDKQIYEEMKTLDFKLKPELANEAMFYWICGSLFGWESVKEQMYIMQKDNNGTPIKIESKEEIEHTKYIRYYKGQYYYWDQDGKSSGLMSKWKPMENCRDRKQAFNFFKTVILPRVKSTLKNKISADLATKGNGYYQALVENLHPTEAAKFDYIDHIVCTDKNSLTYYSQAKGEEALFDEEWEYIKNNLWSTLANL